MNRASGGTLSDDLFLRFGSQDQYTPFSLLAAPAARVFGADWRDTRIMGTDFYKRYIDRKQKEYYDSIENKFNSKKNKPLKIHPEIDKIIMGKRLEKIK